MLGLQSCRKLAPILQKLWKMSLQQAYSNLAASQEQSCFKLVCCLGRQTASLRKKSRNTHAKHEVFVKYASKPKIHEFPRDP